MPMANKKTSKFLDLFNSLIVFLLKKSKDTLI